MKKNGATKKRAAAILAVVALIAALLGTTYAFVDYSQHKTNEFSGGNLKYDVRLVEDFEEVTDWTVNDGPIKKEIRVRNAGSGDEYGPVYVRLVLKEYMEIGDLDFEQTEKRYMIDTDGNFITFTSEAAALAAYPGHEITGPMTDVVTGATGYFVATQAKDPNGQYGKFVVTKYDMKDAVSLVNGVTNHSQDADVLHNVHPNGECEYTIHHWTGTSVFAEYIEWVLGAEVVAYSDWVQNPVLGPFWIYDDVTVPSTGLVYWGEPLNPGDTTENLLEEVVLIKQPNGSFYYALHTDMESVSYDQLWDDIPGELDDLIRNTKARVILSPAGSETLVVGETKNAPKSVEVKPNTASQTVTWSSDDTNIVTVDANGNITGVSKGTTRIWATAENGAKAYYTVVVVDDLRAASRERLRRAIEAARRILDDPDERDKYESAGIEVLDGVTETGEDVYADENLTQKDYDDAAKAIEDAIAALREKEPVIDDKLKLKPGDDFKPVINEEDANDHDFRGKIDGFHDKNWTELQVEFLLGGFSHPYLYWQLDNILDESIADYTKLTVTPTNATKFGGKFSIGKDKYGDWAIVCTYLPTLQEYVDWMAGPNFNPETRPHPEISAEITLAYEGKSTTFNVVMLYDGILGEG